MSLDTSAFLAALSAFPDNVADAAPEALTAFAEAIMEDSKAVCPDKTGELVDSAEVSEPEVSGGVVTVTLSYNTPYALRQHEDLEYRHPVGQAKYLEQPMLDRADEMESFVADYLGGAFEL